LFCVVASVRAAPHVNGTMTGDMYVFAYSWTPEFCYGESYPGCSGSERESFWGDHFTIHGLWPQYTTGGYPASCTTEPFDPAAVEKVGMDTMYQYWPNVQYSESDPNYDEFWEHEWSKHGTCSGLSQYDYFQATINLAKSFGTPSDLTKTADGGTNPTFSASTLRNDLGGPTYVALQCESGKYLSGAYTCWSTDNGKPSKQIVCPTDVQKEDTCTSSTLTIETFPKR